jgi:transcriptional regulator with XRE-family HTH domain
MATAPSLKPGRSRTRVESFDRHLGARIFEKRIMLGVTQHKLAELIGVTYQQLHKYEKGLNRIYADQLYRIARALGVDIDSFFEGIEPRAVRSDELLPQRRLLMAFMRDVVAIPVRRHQKEIVALVRALTEADERRPARPGGAD